MHLTAGRVVEADIVARDVRLRRPLRGAGGPVAVRRTCILRLRGDDGVAGLGEASRVDWLSLRSPAARDDGNPLTALVARIRTERPAARELLAWTDDPSHPSYARAAVQTALVDLEARRRGTSVASLLAKSGTGTDFRGNSCLSPISQISPVLPVCALLGEDEPDAMAREAARRASDGFSCFKIKIGAPRLDDDVARAFAVRAAIGTGAALRLDANGAWTLAQAALALAALEPVSPVFVEEPLRRGEDAASLRSPVAIALDESVRDAADLERALRDARFEVLVLKLERTGGPLAAMAMAARAAGAGVEVVFTDSIESEVGRAATLHTAAAAALRTGDAPAAAPLAGRPPHAVGLGGVFLFDEDVEPRALAEVRGPGLGIEPGRESFA